MDDVKWLIARELPRLRRYAWALRNDSGAEDLVQDCLERALRKHNLWQRGTNIRAWLFRILYNVHLSTLRHSRRQPQFVPYEDLQAASEDGGRQLARIELNELARAVADLPEEQREVVLLAALEGMRYDEIAAVLGIAIGTVRSRLSRGRATLRESAAGRALAPASIPTLRRVK